ncbi:putative Cupin-like domain protein [Paraburkholderia ribeironis]|uniref:Putative Cupin-like domain protein n=1 Tax=Paraburkholderia ribeironis TaxID=1247936 RepID=A0A1N7RLE3_9BURK|nr:cupin domain-containing protein [Paraburkholderia ribeironis]SIT35931.1 putative Cupin-like domain protein [Paraburkholderia ribeironis]
MFDLDTLLHPIPLDRFLRDHWTTKGLVIRSQESGRFNELFSWANLNHLINFHRLRFNEDIRFAAIGKKLFAVPDMPDDWVRQCRDGYTLIINRLQMRLPVIAEMASAIERRLGHRCQVNMYCSWPEQQGFDLHHDDHEVFILQIEGTKRWVVSEGTYLYPLDKYNGITVDTGQPSGPPYIETVLQPGDVLYIPRGHWHFAVACDVPSVHLTVGVTCRTGLYWLKWLADELMCDPGWRRNLPSVVDGDTTDLAEHMRGLLARLAALASDEKLVQAGIAHHLTTQGTRSQEVSLPSQSGFHPFAVDGRTWLRRAKFQPVKVEHEAEHARHRIITATKRITLDGAPNALIDQVFRRERFTVAEAAAWAPDFDAAEEIVPLLRRLVDEGLLVEDAPGTDRPGA